MQNRFTHFSLVFLIAVTAYAGEPSATQPDTSSRDSAAQQAAEDRRSTDWFEARYKEALSIQAGSRYSDLAKYFQEDGGISQPPHHCRFVLIRCPIIKIDVDFEDFKQEKNSVSIPPDTKVISVSKPYFERAFAD
jgi:hypothetical protein